MLEVAIAAGQSPDAAIVFVTLYVPAVLDARFTTPVVELMFNPAVEENMPAVALPVNVGDGSAAL
jgi:hypothetical protein